MSDERSQQRADGQTEAHPSAQRLVQTREWRFVLMMACLVCAITTLPYVIGHVLSPKDMRFTDLWFMRGIKNNYLAYANQAASGQWLFHNPMTAEPHRDIFFNAEWLTMGKLAAQLHITVSTAMQVQRLLAILFFFLGVYWLFALVVKSVLLRRLALTAILLGGGFGWMIAFRKLDVPLDPAHFLDFDAGLIPFFGLSSSLTFSSHKPSLYGGYDFLCTRIVLLYPGLPDCRISLPNGRGQSSLGHALRFSWSRFLYLLADVRGNA
jgi:hypothetical protein